MNNQKFSVREKKSIAGLSVVIGLRMLGLSMLIPVFSVYAIGLPGSTALLAGIAFGVYGLTQALLQIPFGYFSDKFGRKPVVISGLLLFGAGSVICAVTTNIYVLIIGRLLQGGGAIASACFAWIADLTEESRRNMAMAFMGISVGGGIVTGMIFGPVIGGTMGVPFLFWLSAGLSLVAAYVTGWRLKEPDRAGERVTDFGISPAYLWRTAAQPGLMRLNITGFVVNMCMIGTFFVVPIQISHSFSMGQLWEIYLPLSLIGGIGMMISSRKADKGHARIVIITALLALSVSFVIMFLANGIQWTLGGFAIFFTGFSVLEATLPAAVSKLADPERKGTIIGIFNLSQFSGTFVGGATAGLLNGAGGQTMFLVLAVSALIAAGLLNSARELG